MQKPNSTFIIISIILIVLAFVGGNAYGKGHATTASSGASATRTSTSTGAGFAGRGGIRGTTGGGFTAGTIVSVDNGTMTISLSAGGSQIIVLSTSTPILNTTIGSTADLKAGANVMITGTANSDGSLTASSIQIRPASMGGATGFRGGVGAGTSGNTTTQ